MPWMMDIPDPCFGGFYFIGGYVLIIFVDSYWHFGRDFGELDQSNSDSSYSRFYCIVLVSTSRTNRMM
jgi:hypothetical protein